MSSLANPCRHLHTVGPTPRPAPVIFLSGSASDWDSPPGWFLAGFPNLATPEALSSPAAVQLARLICCHPSFHRPILSDLQRRIGLLSATKPISLKIPTGKLRANYWRLALEA
ncbi:hypothetical protein ColLi_03893 [Colletotrichum liriopes]|uniref:Uncharacterized protein n=1 Tax=Colletotrichum liriopes TaxID=708192 RepID=A0AA37LQ33_9PEZI|nr:hypothetical protein ColLi_03893 [Colletotrichum liriopes]